jgi:hypothetical protein
MREVGRLLSKAAFKYLLITILLVACFLPAIPEVKAQSGYLYIYADPVECASVEVYDSFSGSTSYSSFPVSFDLGPYGISYVTITVNAQSGYTFSYAVSGSASYLSSPFSDYFGDGSYLIINFTSSAPSPTPTPAPSATPAPGPSGYSYLFRGLYDEDNVNTLLGNVTVTAYYNGGNVGIAGKSVESFTVIGAYAYYPPSQPLYFSYNLANFYGQNITREYWLSENEVTASLYIYAAPTGLSTVTFNIRALGGVSLTDKFLVARNIYSDTIVEKLPIDSLGNVVMELKAYAIYHLTIENSDSVFSFGDVTMSSSPITLTVSPLSFPSDILLQYRYVHLYASRPNDNEIRIDYEDIENGTVSVAYTVSFINGTVAYSNTQTVDSFTDIWPSADPASSYYVAATVVHSEFGTMYFQQTLTGSAGAVSPVDFAVFGNFGGVDTTQIFGVLIVLIIFGVFSAFNAYIGIFAGVVTAAIMVWIGWLSTVTQGAIVAAFALAILFSITYWKRRVN